MPQRLKNDFRCECGFKLEKPTHFCLNCSKRHALGCGVYTSSSRLFLFFVGDSENELISFRKYEDEVSIRNMYEIAAEKIYERRIDEIVISGDNEDGIEEAASYFRNFLYPFSIARSDVFSSESEFFSKLENYLRIQRSLRKVEVSPGKKIHGSHSTIIGGREGHSLLIKLASSPYIKKIVPGVIENKGVSTGGVRIKLTRTDDRGNIKALLINGATVQQIHIITTASQKEEGDMILTMLKKEMRLE
jgi:hypothetical protein